MQLSVAINVSYPFISTIVFKQCLDFGYRHKLLVDRLLSHGYEVKCLRNSSKKFYGRYPDLIGKHQWSVKDMVADSFPD